MLKTTGSTSRGSARMIVRVVMSRETRVLCTSLAFSILFLHPTTYRGPLEALTITAARRAMGGCAVAAAAAAADQQVCRAQWWRTSLFVQLSQHLAYDLAHTLQCLQVVLRLVELLLDDLHLRSHCQRERGPHDWSWVPSAGYVF